MQGTGFELLLKVLIGELFHLGSKALFFNVLRRINIFTGGKMV
jgi:hypothetical protein